MGWFSVDTLHIVKIGLCCRPCLWNVRLPGTNVGEVEVFFTN